MAKNATFAGIRRPQPVSFGGTAALIGVLLLAVMLGLATVVLPPGFLIRALAIPIGLSFVMFAWMLRSKDAGMPGQWVLALLLITACLSVIWPRYILFSIGGPHVNPQSLAIFASIAASLFCLVRSPEMSAKAAQVFFSAGNIGLLILIWFAWRLLACVLGEHPVHSTVEFVRELVYLDVFILIGCSILCFDNGAKWLLRVIVVAGLLVAFAGLVEAFMQRNPFVQFASAADSEAVADALRSAAVEKFRGGAYRAQSIFSHPISFAQFIAAMLPLGLYCAIYERGVFWRGAGLLLIPVGVLAIVKSGSRAGLVSLAASVAFGILVLWLRTINSRGFGKAVAIAALPLFALGIGVAYLAVQELVAGRTAMEAGSSAVRMEMVRLGVNALADSPLTGFGQGLALSKAGFVNSSGIASIDSYFLSVALDSGYVGLLIFVGIVTIFSFKGAVAAVRLEGAEGVRVGMITASVLAIAATFAGLSISHNLSLMWLLIAMGLQAMSKSAETIRRVNQ